jgi:anti-sigma regulatory factor (Ser/Thr protein kinase)
MRRGLRDLLREVGLPDEEVEDLVLATSEAAGNAVEHADTREPFFDVRIDVAAGVVTVVVQDYGQWRHPRSDTDRGRGLAMMHALADTTVATRSHGTTVTMQHRLPGGGVGWT